MSGSTSGDRRWLRPAVAAAVVAVVLGVVGATLLGGDGGQEAAVPDGETPARAGARERQVRFEGAAGTDVAGTLTLPELAGAPPEGVGGVVVIPGFGPTTRDGLVPPGAVPDPFYRDLSRSFTDAGLATLRYDKRGTGQSQLAPEQALAFDDMVADAAAAVSFLAERAEVDPQRIAVVGHEEGGLVALQLAGADDRVRRLVLVSVPGRPLVEVLSDDFANSGHGEEVATLRSVVDGLLAGQGLPEQAELPPFLRTFFPTAFEGYLAELFALDPVALAAGVDVPTLVVTGEAATGISAADADALTAALGPDAGSAVAGRAGPTLQVVQPSSGEDASDPTSASHDHGMAAPAAVTARHQGAMDRITEFLTAAQG